MCEAHGSSPCHVLNPVTAMLGDRGAVAGQTLAQGDQQLRMAQAVALVLDGPAVLAADRGLTRAEVALAARVAEEGRGIVAVVNKLDTVPPHSRQQACAHMPSYFLSGRTTFYHGCWCTLSN